jgi:hypothetical protein
MFNRKLKKRVAELEREIKSIKEKYAKNYWIDFLQNDIHQIKSDTFDIERKFREIPNANLSLKVGDEVTVRGWEHTYRLTFNLSYGWKMVNTKTGDETWAYNSDITPVSDSSRVGR